jgi:enterochelin esterase family protein
VEIEELEDGRCRVTFRFHDPDAEELWLLGGPAGTDPGDRRLRHAGDGWWEKVVELPRDVRTTYAFTHTRVPGSSALLPDPLNPRQHVYTADPDDPEDEDGVLSLLELPDAPPLRWSVEHDVPHGRVTKDAHAGRPVFLYEPPGGADARTPVVVCFDGQAYVSDAYVPLPTVLDNLVAAGEIPPVVAVLPSSMTQSTRNRELFLDDAFVDLLADELLPWARERVAFTDDPGQTVVAGSSAGGLTAAFCAYRRPARFGLVLSQSGAFQYGLVSEWLDAEARPRFYLDAGILETTVWETRSSLLHANRHLRDVLRAKGYDVTYREYPGGHDYLWWRETVADGLVALLG